MEHFLIRITDLKNQGKPGEVRWQGRRPRTRGVVMNPVDHPMGGGEGKASGGIQDHEQECLQKVIKPDQRKSIQQIYY